MIGWIVSGPGALKFLNPLKALWILSGESHGIMGGGGKTFWVGPSGLASEVVGMLSGKPCASNIDAEASGELAKIPVLGSLRIPISCFGFDFAIFNKKLMSVDDSADCLKVRREVCFAFRSADLYSFRAAL